MIRAARILGLIAAVTILGGCDLITNSDESSVTLSGTVTRGGEPISFVRVTLWPPARGYCGLLCGARVLYEGRSLIRTVFRLSTRSSPLTSVETPSLAFLALIRPP